jgi:hypothetical protein
MLYPKREQPLTEEFFKNPGNEYRATPFWAWNNKLDPNELVWQIEQLKKLGFGGFHMHVRTGMATEYLSDEYMDIVKACVEKARKENMLAWLYDEDRWPSGAAGGLVTKNEKYRIRHLLLTRHPYGEAAPGEKGQFSSFSSARSENGKLIACFDIALDAQGNLKSYKTIDEKDRAQNIKLYAYEESAIPNPWYNNQTYVNTLDPDAIKEFIKVTYEKYQKDFAKDFGGLIPAIFTDEPQFSQKGTLHFANEDRDAGLPWTGGIEESFKAAYGESLIAGLPELLWDLPDGKVSLLRYHYHDHITELFAKAFADQCGSWCEEHGLMLSGHILEEPTLESQTACVGEAMRHYRSFQLPGIDMLCDWREYTTAKQAQSAARQYGRPGVLSELYGVTNWDFDFRGHKLQGDWQAALGVTVRVPHLSWVSMNGEAKRDYPSTFNYQSPWYEEYPYVEDHFARVASAMTRGKPVVRVGVIHPIESYWLHWGARENTQTIREQMDKNFQDLCNWLLRGLVDFDYICESTLPSLCAVKGESRFSVGASSYDVIIVPGMETIRGSTLDRLEAFSKAGGRIIFLGAPPALEDARPNERAKKLWEQSEHIGFERLPLLEALEEVREIGIRDGSGAEVQNLFYQLREEKSPSGEACRWLFIAHADPAANPDIPQGTLLHIKLKGYWKAHLYDTITGEIKALSVSAEQGSTLIVHPCYEHDSLLIKLEPSAQPEIEQGATKESHASAIDENFSAFKLPSDDIPKIRFTATVPVTLHEANVLLLDIAEYALDAHEYRPAEEILKLDNQLRKELSWPLRGDAVAQPWVEQDLSTPHTLKLRYTFTADIALSGTELAMENASAAAVTLNGKKASPVSGWYVDKCIGKIQLPEINAGTNVLEVSFPYGKKVNVESLYLLGNFGVDVQGTSCTLTKPVTRLAFGDITRQGLPFYGGNISYHLEADLPADNAIITASCYRGHLLKVNMDGANQGVIAYSPYRLTLKGKKGKHKIDILYFGSRVNTFGQLHNNIRTPGYWWGPNSWRSSGAAWTYEYRFWPQGVLKSPEISQE